jgi:hypothetical protein
MNGTKESQPYMGVIKVSRCQGRVNLFDSDVEHHNFIEVSVCHAERERHLSSNWIHDREEIVAVRMSEIQWAQFVSSFNQGSGTPVTLAHILMKRVEEPASPKNEASVFHKEVTDTVVESLNALKDAMAKVEQALVPKAKTLNKGELAAILSDLRMAVMHFTNNVPFVEKRFGEHIEEKLTEAKVEFEGYLHNRLRNLGLQAAALNAAAEEAPKPYFLTEGAKNDQE